MTKSKTTGRKYKTIGCEMCGKTTILRPIGINFLDIGVEDPPIEGVKAGGIPTFEEALERADEVQKVCTHCKFGTKISKDDIHYWTK